MNMKNRQSQTFIIIIIIIVIIIIYALNFHNSIHCSILVHVLVFTTLSV